MICSILTHPGMFVTAEHPEPINFEGMQGEFFLHRLPRVQFGQHTGWKNEWMVYEATSGCRLLDDAPVSKDAAIFEVQRLACQPGVQQRLDKAVAETIEVWGAAPRVAS